MSLKETAFYKVRHYYIQPEAKIKDRVNVAILGDFHISPIVTGRQNYEAYKRLIKLEPELIVLQGDLIDSPTEFFDEESVKKLKDTLKMCARIAPTVMVLGGHDYIIPIEPAALMDVIPLWKEICEECKVHLLMDEWYETDTLRVFGFFQDKDFTIQEDGELRDNPEVMEKRLADLKLEPEPDKINWFVSHSPSMTRRTKRYLKNFDVLSFGHTHGGCVPIGLDFIMDKLNLHGGLVSPDKKPFPKVARGAKQISDDTSMVINSGMIATHYSAKKPLQYLNMLKKGEITEIVFEPPETA
ncbi:metallophosphoesterase [Candidatus Saccharibacteria bacterium]|nr:metallophosphoesterase [Candidatus Saccharibacteria bacterium]